MEFMAQYNENDHTKTNKWSKQLNEMDLNLESS